MNNRNLKTNLFDKFTMKFSVMALTAALLSAAPFHSAYAAAPALGTSATYAILAGPSVTLTDSTVTGDVGTGLPFSTVTQTNSAVNGVVRQGDVNSMAAYNAFLGSYTALATEPCNVTLTGTLAGQVLAPNVYCFDAAATLTGQLTLDGPANGVWIFKVGNLGTGALTGTNFSVVMAGGGQACNVYWWVADAVTMTTSNFQGTILAGIDSTFTGGSLIGRDLSIGAATLTGTAVSSCGSGPILPPIVPGKDHDKDHDKNHDKDHDKDHDKNCSRNHDNDHDKDHGEKKHDK